MRFSRLALFFAAAIFLSQLSACFQFRASEKKLYRHFEGGTYQPVFDTFQVADRSMHFMSVNIDADSLPLLLFVHGAPGSIKVFASYLADTSLSRRSRMLAIDRAGYGRSDFGKAEVSIERQADLIRPLIERYRNDQPAYLVGYSYGGPIIARIAMKYPELVDELVIVSGATDPDNETVYCISYPGNWFFIRWILPRAVRVTNQEKLSHVEQLKLLLPDWHKVQVPTTILHGLADKLVVPANAHFTQQQLSHVETELILIPDQKHRIPYDQPQVLKKVLQELLD